MLSSEYGWKTVYILSLTLREIDWRIKAIGKRQDKQFEIDAAFHGMKTKGAKVKVDLDKESKDKLDKVIQARMEKGVK